MIDETGQFALALALTIAFAHSLNPMNWKDKPGDGAAWHKKFGSPYLMTGDDAAGRLGIGLGVTGVPQTFLIDATGRIRYRHAVPLAPVVRKDVFEPMLAELRSRR